jgi:multidrug efflux system membrane fusion protein
VGCAKATARRSQRVPIAVAFAQQRTVPYEIQATGTVEPTESASVIAQVGGLLTRVAFREGDEVRAGQVLFQVDPRPFESAVAQAAAVLARDRAQAEAARLDRERAEALAKQQLIAPGDLDQKVAGAEALAASVRADSAALATARLNLAFATVRAPISGKTGALRAHVGDLVKASDPTAPLITINQVHPIRVRFTVTQSDIPELRRQLGREIRVEVAAAEHDSMWSAGRLVFTDNQVDDASGTLLLKGELPNQDRALWPGQFVRVRLRLYEQKDATVVPAVAVTNSQNGTYCFIVKPDTTVEARPVVVQRTWGELAVIVSGIEVGERVVTDGQLRLSPGAKAVIRGDGAGAKRGEGL